MSINKGKELGQAILRAEGAINMNYNRTIKASPISIIQGYDIYDPLKRSLYFKLLVNKKNINVVKLGETCRERLYNTGKLGAKYSRSKIIEKISDRGYWVKLSGNKGWTHVKNLKF